MIFLGVVSGELSTLQAPSFAISVPGAGWLALSCIVGTGISYAGWWCRSCVSATSYTVIGVVNKAITPMLNSLIAWQAAGTSLLGFFGLGCAIGGGLVYRQAPLRSAGVAAPASGSGG